MFLSVCYTHRISIMLQQPLNLLNFNPLIFAVYKITMNHKFVERISAELDEIMLANPLPAAVETPSRFLIAVARDAEALRKLEPLAKLNWGSERLVLGKRAAYMWSPDGILEGRMMDAVGKAAGDGITARNWATCGKIAATAKEIAG